MTRIIELSHPIHDGMPSYPGLPAPRVGLHLDHDTSRPAYDHRAEFAIGRVEMVGNVGTYLDSPYHRYRDGPDVSQLPLDRLVDLPTVMIDATQYVRTAGAHGRQLEPTITVPLAGRAVLVQTGWDARWGTERYFEPGPYLGPALVDQLVHGRPAVVGVDFWNVDNPDDPTRPAHTHLLGEGIPIVEHLRNLDTLPVEARTYIVPLGIRAMPSAPVRAFALTP